MDLILSPDFLATYLSLVLKNERNSVELICYLTIQNTNNNFLLSKKLLEFYENTFDSIPGAIDIYQTLLADIINNRMIHCFGCNNNDINILMSDMESQYIYDASLHKSSILVNISKTISQSFNNVRSGILDLYSSNIQSKLILELAAYNPRAVVFEYHEFLNNTQIQNLFDCYFQLCHSYLNYAIFDRQTNLSHNLFNVAITSGKRVHYYTKSLGNSAAISENRIIRTKFRSYAIYRIQRNNVHERKLKINNFILSTDEDFWNLNINRHTWSITFFVCDTRKQIIENRKNQFIRDRRI